MEWSFVFWKENNAQTNIPGRLDREYGLTPREDRGILAQLVIEGNPEGEVFWKAGDSVENGDFNSYLDYEVNQLKLDWQMLIRKHPKVIEALEKTQQVLDVMSIPVLGSFTLPLED